jgi:hypothetical protein
MLRDDNQIADEIFEERAAILEYDALMTREDAERLAMLESEQYREACEVRSVLKMPSKLARRDYLQRVRDARGDESADRLERLVIAEYERKKSRGP